MPPPAPSLVHGSVITVASLPPLPVVQPFHALIYPLEPSTFRALAGAYAVYAEALVATLPRAVQVWLPPERRACCAHPPLPPVRSHGAAASAAGGYPPPTSAPARPTGGGPRVADGGGAGCAASHGGRQSRTPYAPHDQRDTVDGSWRGPPTGSTGGVSGASTGRLSSSSAAAAHPYPVHGHTPRAPPAVVSVLRCPDARRPHRLRVGYVSSDFVNHPYAHLTRSVYGLHAAGCAVECFCYALTPADGSAWRVHIEATAEHFRDISGMDTATAAAAIAADGLHVLVNANGYTKGARSELFALRPAPVQVSFMGFAGTMAARSIDYSLTDAVVTPPATRCATYAEPLLLHPHSYFVCDHAQSAALDVSAAPTAAAAAAAAAAAPPPVVSRARYGLPEDAFLFINFNQTHKLDASTFAMWARILHACPHSKLWLLRFPADAEPRIRATAAAHGLPADAIIFTVRASSGAGALVRKVCFFFSSAFRLSERSFPGMVALCLMLVPCVSGPGKCTACAAVAAVPCLSRRANAVRRPLSLAFFQRYCLLVLRCVLNPAPCTSFPTGRVRKG